MSSAQARSDLSRIEDIDTLGLLDEARPARLRLLPEQLLAVLAGLDFVLVAGSTLLVAVLYHVAMVGTLLHAEVYAVASPALGLAFCIAAALDGQYASDRLRDGRGAAVSALKSLNGVFAVFVCLLFLTHVTDVYSRGSLVLQYGLGCAALALARLVTVRLIRRSTETGRVEAQRIGLIGPAAGLEEFAARLPAASGINVAVSLELPPWAAEPLDDGRRGELERITAGLTRTLRAAEVDDIVVLLPWNAVATLRILTQHLAALPVGLKFRPDHDLFGPHAPDVQRLGSGVVMGLQRPPLSAFDQIAKRCFDVAAASTLLVLAAPLMVLIAVAIKLDSRGPVLFRQQRHGFNQKSFRVLKFRTMTTMDDGDTIKQARANDPRVTFIGRMLRRSNLDELPQLYNVLRGEMSLVGPRPHALAHDREYERKIPLYARRHKVKPGLTGWAQVNGWRGETDTDVKMEKRVEYDLFYIDNWSLLFDIQIIVMTLLSKKAYKNAC